MIDKVIPQRLNSDVDSRFRPSTDMIDALNVVFNESYKGNAAATGNTASNDFSGDSGVIKPTPSNKSIEDIFLFENVSMPTPANSSFVRVIGSVSDELFNIIYFFAFSSNSNEMGIYAWDGDGILPGTPAPGSYVRVYTSPKFNFPSDGFVKADVVHVGQREGAGEFSETIRNVVVYFTDNRNEPKKINVYQVMEANLNFYNDRDILDMITACPRTPQHPISFRFDFDPERNVSNFSNLPGLQFAYQYVYNGNVDSPLSTYSKIAVPPAYLTLGAVSGGVNLENRCVLTIPRGTREVVEIKILTRYGNTGSWRLIDSIPIGNNESPLYDALGDITYNYYNDRILIPVSEERSNMPFSNLPRIAQAQTVISDRLVYGNYVEQYPDVEVSGSAVPVYNTTPSDTEVIQREVIPVINQKLARPDVGSEELQDLYKKFGTNRVAGYQINLDGVPDDFLSSGTTIQIDFTVVPDNNFHFYNQQNSYHGGKEAGFFGGLNGTGNLLDNVNDPADSDNPALYTKGRRYFGKNKGVKFIEGDDDNSPNVWTYQNWTIFDGGEISPATESFQGFGTTDPSVPISYGTSAANPFILQGKPLRFAVTFKTNYDTEDPKPAVRDAIYNLFTGDVAMPNSDGVDFATIVEGAENQIVSSYDIDLDLENNDKIFAQSGNDYRKHLIVGVGLQTEDGSTTGSGTNSENAAPVGYFIVNKAQVSFRLKAFTYMATGLYGSLGTQCYLGLDLESLNNVETFTCIPYVPANNHIGVTITGGHLNGNPVLTNQYQGETFIGTIPLNLINGNIKYWMTFSKEYMQSTDPSEMSVYTPEASWVADPPDFTFGADTVTNPIDRNDPRNMYFFGVNQYQNVVREQTNTNENSSAPTSIGYDALGLSLFPANHNPARGRFCLGYLSSPDSLEDLKLINTSAEIFNSSGLSSTVAKEMTTFSLVDGEGGPSFATNKSGVGQKVSWGSVSPYILFKGDIHNRWVVSSSDLPSETFNTSNPSANDGTADPLNLSTNFPDESSYWKKGRGVFKIFRNPVVSTPRDSIGLNYSPAPESNLSYNFDIPSTLNTWVEVSSVTTFAVNIEGAYYPRSFKTNANHDFGIVYYDQRGRSGNVNYLDNVYVAGYSNQERGLDEKGRVDVLISIDNDPPSWATHYQIVYSPNSTVQDFVQYTTGPAFLEKTTEIDPVDNDESLIYVSLGYLQGINNISYAHAFGAVSKDGSKDLYVHQQGDKLRVLYYTDINGEDIVYPRNYVFDVVDVVTLSKNATENFLFNGENAPTGSTVSPAEAGQFLVLKDNREANGFSYADVLSSYPDDEDDSYFGATDRNYWNNQTVVEIFSPKRAQDFDQRFYYEIGEKYDIGLDGNGNAVHSQTTILLRDGDVWWRKVPVNTPEYNSEDFTFTPLLRENETEDISLPRFKNKVLEVSTFTDLIPAANGLDWGKPKVIIPSSQSLYKRSSLTYSERNNYTSKSNNFTTFNAGKLNFKDLPNEYGAINYIVNDYDNAVVVQEDKVSSVPVNRNIISTAGGDQSLVAAQEVLGTQKFYAGNYGADNNPEGVVRAGEAIYFAHKNKREVYKLTRSKGIQVISKANMRAYFNNIFTQALAEERANGGKVRVVSGYDPLRDEYIISIYNMQDFSDQEINYDPLTGVFDDVEIIDPIDDDGGVDPGDPPGPEEPSDDDGTTSTGGGGGKPDDAEPEDDRKRTAESEEDDPKTIYLGLSASDLGFTRKGETAG